MFNDSLHREKELLHSIAEGNETAFTKLFNYYHNRVYSIAFNITHTASIAEEIVQEVFLKIWLKRADLVAIQDFRAYLFIITRNQVYSSLKQQARSYKVAVLRHEEEIVVQNSGTDAVTEKEYNLLLHKAVNRLPQQQKQVYQLIKDQGLKRDEVAGLLHLQPETVKFHLAAAMKKVRAFCMLYMEVFAGFIFGLSFFV